MWTNVFKIAGLHQISWFQFLPHEPDLNTIIDKSAKADQKDAAMLLVLSSHLQLQKLGCLSTWTNSFVGPWDPSQGLHNPDEKIKLWLFLPGRHSSVVESVQPAVSRLKVVASGLWLAPGDSEEVAAALSQALRNCIERSLVDISYMRFGDVFSKYHPSESEELSRVKPTVEFIFSTTEEAIFVHVIISAKRIRALSGSDLERVSKHSMDSAYRLPVIVSPHGMRGRLIGRCPSDLVKQVYFSNGKMKTSNGVIGLPHHVLQGFGYQLMGQSCYVEIAIGLSKSGGEKTKSNSLRNLPRHHPPEFSLGGRSDCKRSLDPPSGCEKSFIYPIEAVLVPVLQTSFARSSLRRFWLQNWMGPSLPGSSFFMHCDGSADSADSLWSETNGIRSQNDYDSSSNSNSSSISSLSRSSSDTENKISTGSGELEADADSLSCRQSGLSSGDPMEHDVSKLVSQRTRTGMTESISQVVTAGSGPMQDAYKSQYGSLGNDNSVVTGIVNDLGSHWDWDDDDRGMGMDIQALLSEFGDFGDFFENDALPFGEPPGTAESQALMFSAPECGDVGSSPAAVLDVSDHMLLPAGLPSFDSLNSPSLAAMEESLNKNKENMSNTTASASTNHTQVSFTGEFDHIIKAEALMTFAPEFGAVEAPTSELSTTPFRSPYLPKSRELESSNSSSNVYYYSAAPPPSPCIDGSDVKRGIAMNLKSVSGNQDGVNGHQSKHYYTHIESRREHDGKRSRACSDSIAAAETVGAPQFSNISSINALGAVPRKTTEGTLDMEHFLLPLKNVLATEIECVLFQASMCRIRHILLSSSSFSPIPLSRMNGMTMNQLSSDPSTITENTSSKYELKKKENIPLRIAGDMDGGMLDGHLNAPVGVWRTVGVSKVGKPSNSQNMEVSSSFSHNSFNDETMLTYGQRQPLQELLDGISLLVQQATSFVDLSLDSDCGDGPYGWLALQEQWRRGFSCGPSIVHAGCGGALASCHSLDIAGVELVDPFYSEVNASSLISLLQSDIKSALKSAFSSLEGPMSVIDWCKGRSLSSDAGSVADGFPAESGINELRDFCGEPISPSQSSVSGTSSLKVSSIIDGGKVDEQRRTSQEFCSSDSEQQSYSWLKPTLTALPFPSILVGYQDDWLKTSANSLQFWEKAPFEPYALQKPVSYCVICPDIDPLTVAATDFFQQLGTVYETCKLGTHSPQSLGNQMEIDTGKGSSTGFVFLDSPQSMKFESNNASLVGSISDYFLSLSNGWDLTSYLKSLSKALRALKLGPYLFSNSKEGSSGCSLVIYVVCPFPDPAAVLQTIVESSVAVGSTVHQADRDRRAILHSHVGKALSGLAAVDEASVSNIPVLSGFSVPKLVLQIVTVDAIFRVMNPALSELVILKETAFTVYSKARRISRGSYNEMGQSSLSGRPHTVLTQMSPPISGMWKDCVGPRIAGHSISRDGDIDASLRSGHWENAWQPTRTGGLTCDPNRMGEYFLHDELRYMFEPLFILSEPGSMDNGIPLNVCGNLASESSKILPEDSSGGMMQIASGSTESASSSQVDGSEHDQKTQPSLHCCYGWTEDWRWLVCIWTDSRGELLDSNVFPFGGISSRQDTKGLQCLFVQVLQQGCQILQACLATDTGVIKPRDFVITRIGNFFELEYLEWQKAIYSMGSSEMKRWPLQLRRMVADGMPTSSNGTCLQPSEMSLIQERTLSSSPGPLYSPVTKSSFMKGSLGQAAGRKQLMGAHSMVDNSRGLLQWAQSISFIAVFVDHSLQLLHPVNMPSPGGSSSNGVAPSSYVEGFTPVKSLGSTPATYILIPSPSMRFLPSTPLQLPTCLTAESPPLAHLLHSKGSAVPLSTGFVVSKAVPSMRRDCSSSLKDEKPSVLSVSLIDYYGNSNTTQEKIAKGITKQSGRSLSWEPKDLEIESRLILESLAAELHGLSWMTVSPAYLERRTALPFHCDMVLRLRRLLHFADKELSRQSEKW